MANNWISINNLMGISSRDVKQHMIKNEKLVEDQSRMGEVNWQTLELNR
jgi:hypothetical protein